MVENSKLDEDKEGKAVDPSHYREMEVVMVYGVVVVSDLVMWWQRGAAVVVVLEVVAARGGEWCGGSSRSGEGEYFWGSLEKSPETAAGGGGSGYRKSECFEEQYRQNKVQQMGGARERAYAIDGGIRYSVVSSRMNQLH
nr:hypothetical protein [Tanacetum cinerariifolium]